MQQAVAYLLPEGVRPTPLEDGTNINMHCRFLDQTMQAQQGLYNWFQGHDATLTHC